MTRKNVFIIHSRRNVMFIFLCIALSSVITLNVAQHLIGYDPLASKFINGDLVQIDSWSFIHLFVFACCGSVFPSNLSIYMLTGIIWEIIEYILAGDSDFWSERGVNTIWDLWFNLAGYRLGELFRFLGAVGSLTKFNCFWCHRQRRHDDKRDNETDLIYSHIIADVSALRKKLDMNINEKLVPRQTSSSSSYNILLQDNDKVRVEEATIWTLIPVLLFSIIGLMTTAIGIIILCRVELF